MECLYIVYNVILLSSQMPPHSSIITYANTQRTHRRHVGFAYLNYWENGLREASYRTFIRKGYTDPTLKDQIINAPLIGLNNRQTTPFGDVAVLARGQLYYSAGGLLFVQDERSYDCDECKEERIHESHGQILALWTVRRLRHHDKSGFHRYEIEYLISPVTGNNHLSKNGAFDYSIPGYVFVLKNNQQENNKNYLQPTPAWYNTPSTNYLPVPYKEDRYYLPPATTESTFYYTTPKIYRHDHKHYHYYDPDVIPAINNVEKEVELYKILVESLKSTPSTSNINSPPPLPPTPNKNNDILNKIKPIAAPSTLPMSSTYNSPNTNTFTTLKTSTQLIRFPETTPFKPSPMYTRYSEPDPLYITTPSRPSTNNNYSFKTTAERVTSYSEPTQTSILTTYEMPPEKSSAERIKYNQGTKVPPTISSTVKELPTSSLSQKLATKKITSITKPISLTTQETIKMKKPITDKDFDIFDIFDKQEQTNNKKTLKSTKLDKMETSEKIKSQILLPENIETTTSYVEPTQTTSLKTVNQQETKSSTETVTKVDKIKNIEEIKMYIESNNEMRTNNFVKTMDQVKIKNHTDEYVTAATPTITYGELPEEQSNIPLSNISTISLHKNIGFATTTGYKNKLREATTKKESQDLREQNTKSYKGVSEKKFTKKGNEDNNSTNITSFIKLTSENPIKSLEIIESVTSNTDVKEINIDITTNAVISPHVSQKLIQNTSYNPANLAEKSRHSSSFIQVKEMPNINTTIRPRKYKYSKLPKRKNNKTKTNDVITTNQMIDYKQINSQIKNFTSIFNVTTENETTENVTPNLLDQMTSKFQIETFKTETYKEKTSESTSMFETTTIHGNVKFTEFQGTDHSNLSNKTMLEKALASKHDEDIENITRNDKQSTTILKSLTEEVTENTILSQAVTPHIDTSSTNSSQIFEDIFGIYSKEISSTVPTFIAKKYNKLNKEFEEELFGTSVQNFSNTDFEDQSFGIEYNNEINTNQPKVIFDNFYEPSTLPSTISVDYSEIEVETSTFILEKFTTEAEEFNNSISVPTTTLENIENNNTDLTTEYLNDMLEENITEYKSEGSELQLIKIINNQTLNHTQANKRQTNYKNDTLKANVTQIDVGDDNFLVYKAEVDEKNSASDNKGCNETELFERLALSIVNHAKTIEYLNRKKQGRKHKRVVYKYKNRRRQKQATKS